MGKNALKWLVIGRTVERLQFSKTNPISCSVSRVMSTDIPPLKGRKTSDEAPGRKPFLTETSKVYELRQYNCPPGKFPEYLQLTKEYLHLRVKHSKLFGFWTSELGGLNQSVHLWEYDNLDHRARVRKDLANDAEWKGKYLSKALPLMVIQDNSVIVPFSWSPVIQPSNNGYYEMQIFNMSDHVEVWHDRLKKAILLRSEALEPLNTKLLGVFYTIFGKQNSVITFWQHESLKKATEGKIRLLNEAKDATLTAFYHEVGMSYSKAMTPFSIDNVK